MLPRSTGPEPGPMCRSARARTRSLRVRASREPVHARNRHRLVCLPAEFRHARRTCLDVVDREVRPGTALAGLHVGDRRALLAANLCGLVFERAGICLELPPEQGAPEFLARLGVVRRDLDVHDLTWQRCLLISSFTVPPSLRSAARPGQTHRWSARRRSLDIRTLDRIMPARSHG
jgi:hypothetical protein